MEGPAPSRCPFWVCVELLGGTADHPVSGYVRRERGRQQVVRTIGRDFKNTTC